MKHYVIGHEKQDLDSVVSAIAIAELFTKDPGFGYSEVQALITAQVNNESAYILEKFGVAAPQLISEIGVGEDDRFILVDHNEESQRAASIFNEQIVEIIDHHKVKIDISSPIYITMKPWGSTATIIYSMMRSHDYKPATSTAQLLLSAILSDTVGLKSATTTAVDKEYAAELSEIAEITNLDELTLEIFKAKSEITSLSPQEIVKKDYKMFDIGGKKVFIGQVETVEQQKVLESVNELVTAMDTVAQQEGADIIFLAITDILAVNTKLLFRNGDEQMIIEKAFEVESDIDHILDIGPRMSRKKEIAPPIEAIITQQ